MALKCVFCNVWATIVHKALSAAARIQLTTLNQSIVKHAMCSRSVSMAFTRLHLHCIRIPIAPKSDVGVCSWRGPRGGNNTFPKRTTPAQWCVYAELAWHALGILSTSHWQAHIFCPALSRPADASYSKTAKHKCATVLYTCTASNACLYAHCMPCRHYTASQHNIT